MMVEQNTASQIAMQDQQTLTKIREWVHYVRGKIIGEKRSPVFQPIQPEYSIEGWQDIEYTMETENTMVLEIPVRELASMTDTQEWYRNNIGGYSMERFDKLVRNNHSEEYLRSRHPGLQEAWEQYQIMLALCSDKTFK